MINCKFNPGFPMENINTFVFFIPRVDPKMHAGNYISNKCTVYKNDSRDKGTLNHFKTSSLIKIIAVVYQPLKCHLCICTEMCTYPVHSSVTLQCRVCRPFLTSGHPSVCCGVLLYLPERSSFFILDVFKVVRGQVQHKLHSLYLSL